MATSLNYAYRAYVQYMISKLIHQ